MNHEKIEVAEGFFHGLGLRNVGNIIASRDFLSPRIYRGYLLIVIGLMATTGFLYATTVSKLLPYSGLPLLDAIKDDHYFCYLIPMMLIPAYFTIYVNWLADQVFNNN
jgi:phosphatidylinositol N-acetylglucosaminyltransferase subunit Y